jgi:hypothetical protein
MGLSLGLMTSVMVRLGPGADDTSQTLCRIVGADSDHSFLA